MADLEEWTEIQFGETMASNTNGIEWRLLGDSRIGQIVIHPLAKEFRHGITNFASHRL